MSQPTPILILPTDCSQIPEEQRKASAKLALSRIAWGAIFAGDQLIYNGDPNVIKAYVDEMTQNLVNVRSFLGLDGRRLS